MMSAIHSLERLGLRRGVEQLASQVERYDLVAVPVNYQDRRPYAPDSRERIEAEDERRPQYRQDSGRDVASRAERGL